MLLYDGQVVRGSKSAQEKMYLGISTVAKPFINFESSVWAHTGLDNGSLLIGTEDYSHARGTDLLEQADKLRMVVVVKDMERKGFGAQDNWIRYFEQQDTDNIEGVLRRLQPDSSRLCAWIPDAAPTLRDTSIKQILERSGYAPGDEIVRIDPLVELLKPHNKLYAARKSNFNLDTSGLQGSQSDEPAS